MQQDHIIVGIHMKDRINRAADFQKLLSNYGCNIKTRIGLHEVSENFCSPNGLILLELAGDPAECRKLIDELKHFEGLDIQTMIFDHD